LQQKRLEKQIKDSERLAAIGATAGMVGHDIRNPLQAITGDLYLAKTELSALPEMSANQMLSLSPLPTFYSKFYRVKSVDKAEAKRRCRV
jgi:signal transduction histidine kinase